MDFNKSIQIATSSSTFLNLNSITSSPSANKHFDGYVTQDVSFSNASIGGFIDPLAQRDGAEADLAIMGVRGIQMIVQVYGSTIGAFNDNINALNSALQPYPSFASANDGFRALDFYQPTVSYAAYSSTGIPVRLYVRPTALPSYQINNDLFTPRVIGSVDRGLAATFRIGLMAKDPRKVCQTAVSGTFTSSTATQTITNNGNYNAYPTFTLASTSPQSVTISSAYFTASILVSGTTASATVVNSDTRVVTYAGSLNMSKVNAATTTFPFFVGGNNSVTVTPSSSWTGLTVSYTFNEAWL